MAADKIRYVLFVYDALRKGGTLHGHLADSEFAGKGNIQGLLYDTGELAMGPGLVVQWRRDLDRIRRANVVGEMYHISEETLALLDQMFGYYPRALRDSLFVRDQFAIRQKGGENRVVPAWAYEWNWPTEGLPLIEHGDYMRYLKEHRGGE